MRSHQVEVKPLPPLSHSLLVSFQNQPPKRCVRSPDLACTSNLGALPCTLPPLPALWVSLLKAGPEVVAQSHDPNQVSNNSEDNHPMCLTTFMGNIPPPANSKPEFLLYLIASHPASGDLWLSSPQLPLRWLQTTIRSLLPLLYFGESEPNSPSALGAPAPVLDQAGGLHWTSSSISVSVLSWEAENWTLSRPASAK